jgi:hypothetical protein
VDRVLDLRLAINGLAEIDPISLSDDALGEMLVELHGEASRLLAVEAKVTSVFDIRRAWRDDGSRSLGAWLERRCHTSRRASRAQVRRAKRLRGMPLTAAALAAGEIDDEHVTILTRLAGSARKVIADAFGEAEEMLVGYAKTLGFREFVAACRYWEDVVDPDGTEDQAGDDIAARRLHVSETYRGNVVIDGLLDPVAGAVFNTALERITHELFKADWADAKALHGDDTRAEHLARTPAQRRADALVEMAKRANTAPADGKEPKPLIVFVVGYEHTGKRLCELLNRTVVTPGQIVPYLSEAEFQRMVYGPDNKIIELSKKARFFTGGLREVLDYRDRHCTHPGCHEPAEFSEGDHYPVPHSHGGPTTQDNGTLHCGIHNRYAYNHVPDDDP